MLLGVNPLVMGVLYCFSRTTNIRMKKEFEYRWHLKDAFRKTPLFLRV